METTISNFFYDVDFNSSDTCEITKDDCVQCHCGVSYPDEIRDKSKPKLNTSSIKYYGKI